MFVRFKRPGAGSFAANPAGRTQPSRLRLEDLEERLLLSSSQGVYPDYITGAAPATTPLEQAQAAALRDIHGPTLTANDGPLAKIGLDLAEVYEEYQLFTAGADTTSSNSAFVPSNSEIQIKGDDVALDASATTDVQALDATLSGLGMTVLATTPQVVSGWFPISQLNSLATVSGLQFARADSKPIDRAGSVDSQGDQAINAPAARTQFGVNGTGITVGIISDSFDTSGQGSAAADIASGDLPAAGVDVLGDSPGGTDEGRAMTQIVHDVAPGAAIDFDTAGVSEVTFAQSILALQAAGAQVIADDVGFDSEPFFQDGVSAQAIDKVANEGVAYFSAAGNDGDAAYAAPFNASTVTGPAGGALQNFGTSSAVVTQQQVTVPLGDDVPFDLQWTQPFQSLGGAGASSQLNIYLLDNTGTIVAEGNDPVMGSDPMQEMDFSNDGSFGSGGGETTFTVEIELASGPAPALMQYVGNDDGDGFQVNTFNTASGTDFGHPTAAGAIGVAAAAYYNTPAFGQTPALLESFSSEGGIPIYFDTSGNLLSTPEIRQSPAVTGPDGVNTTFFDPTPPGATLPSNPVAFNFFGTSAATPHVAAVAALMLQEAGGPGSLTPDEIRTTLEQTATPISGRTDGSNPGSAVTPIPGPVGVNYYAGYGLVDADKAVDAVSLKLPTAVDDTAVTNEDVSVPIDVLANDTPGTNAIDPTTVSIVQQPVNGTVQVDPNTGIVTYEPNNNFSGTDSFTYTVSDVDGNVSNVAGVSITVNFVDHPPIAVNDLAATQPGKPVTINVLANDHPFSAQATIVPSTLKIVQQPLNGTAQVVNNQIVYTPLAGFVGGDSLEYTVADNFAETSNVASVAIRVGDPIEVSGFAYVDANGDGVKESGETGIPNVMIELTKTNGNYTFTTFALTGPDGAYHFVEGTNYILPAGVYNIKEIQPGFFVSGTSTMGTPAAAGPNGNGQFDNITLAPDGQATGYNFGAQGLSATFAAAYFNRRAFLSSTGPAFTGLNLQAGTNWISFDAGVQGTLSAVAQFNPALGNVTMALLDSNMQSVATSTSVGGQAELSFTGQSTSPYFLQLTGTNPNVSVKSYATGAPVVPPPTTPTSQFHNSLDPPDVNDDGLVSALDALIVINDLDAGKVGALSALTGLGASMVDVNGDGELSALDALIIINDLNATAASVAAPLVVAQAAAGSAASGLATPATIGALPAATSAAATPTDTSSVAFALAVAQTTSRSSPASVVGAGAVNAPAGSGPPNSAAANSSQSCSTAAAGTAMATARPAIRPMSGSSQLASLIWTDEEAW